MYKDVNNYQPFSHKGHETKNKLLTLARDQKTEVIEGVFTAALIYTNLVDYLARHLLENLWKMVSIHSYKSFGAIFYLDSSKQKMNQSLGAVIKHLQDLEFSDKEDFLYVLNDFNKSRNNIMHKLMDVDLDANNVQSFEKDLSEISRLAEEILLKYNTISAGIITVWQTIYPSIEKK